MDIGVVTIINALNAIKTMKKHTITNKTDEKIVIEPDESIEAIVSVDKYRVLSGFRKEYNITDIDV